LHSLRQWQSDSHRRGRVGCNQSCLQWIQVIQARQGDRLFASGSAYRWWWIEYLLMVFVGAPLVAWDGCEKPWHRCSWGGSKDRVRSLFRKPGRQPHLRGWWGARRRWGDPVVAKFDRQDFLLSLESRQWLWSFWMAPVTIHLGIWGDHRHQGKLQPGVAN